MKTQIVIMFEPKEFETASDFLADTLMQVTAFLKKNYIELYYQMSFPNFTASWACPVEAADKKRPQHVVMPVETEEGDLLLTTQSTR